MNVPVVEGPRSRGAIARKRTGGVVALVVVLGAACGTDAGPASPQPIESPTAAASSTSAESPASTPSATPAPLATPVAAAPFPVEGFATISEGPVSADLAAKFQETLEIVAAGGGITATVMTPQGTWSGAFGKADGVDDVVVESQFGLGSITKAIVAAQVMQLVEAGEIDVDAPATDYLPAHFLNYMRGATVRQLLSHRSGIPEWFSDEIWQDVFDNRARVWDMDDILGRFPAPHEPGVVHEYADTNFILLGLVLEHVRGRPLVEILREGVLAVDGTDRLIVQPDEAPTDPMAMPMGETRDALEKGGGYLPSMSDATTGFATASMASDSISLARWWRAFCAGEIVSQATLTEMASFYDGPEPYGLGLTNFLGDAAEGVGHLGANFGYRAAAGCVTDEPIVVVVLTNQEPMNPGLAVGLALAALSD